MSAHSVPLSCPYCAGENLHPHQDQAGAWECRECLRVFAVRFLGLLPVAEPEHSEGRSASPARDLSS